ncbi:hypothetical protein AB0M20_15745 [Actinoplanes sp. NPDC051633]|uniref:hypothetical protein n=1 Tax=Actinoplanes sp. NPDC051633 TaxID=3155670 RepID=UPI00343A3BAC
MADDDFERAVAGRKGWHLTRRVATFDPGSGWTGRVTEVMSPAKWSERFHAAVVSPTGVARHTMNSALADQAVTWVERVTKPCQGSALTHILEPVFEQEGLRLVAALREKVGPAPDWTVRETRHGLALLYRRDQDVDPRWARSAR